MKLNSKRTILVGLAFLSISAFWQMYDSVMNLILTGTFHLNETLSGAIMAADQHSGPVPAAPVRRAVRPDPQQIGQAHPLHSCGYRLRSHPHEHPAFLG